MRQNLQPTKTKSEGGRTQRASWRDALNKIIFAAAVMALAGLSILQGWRKLVEEGRASLAEYAFSLDSGHRPTD